MDKFELMGKCIDKLEHCRLLETDKLGKQYIHKLSSQIEFDIDMLVGIDKRNHKLGCSKHEELKYK